MTYPNAYPYGAERHFVSGEWIPFGHCGDCGVPLGEHHRVNCLQARCPCCGDQAACCEHGGQPCPA